MFSGVRSSTESFTWVAWARAATTASSVWRSWAAYPFTVSTRFGTRSARRWYWFSTSAQAPETEFSAFGIDWKPHPASRRAAAAAVTSVRVWVMGGKLAPAGPFEKEELTQRP